MMGKATTSGTTATHSHSPEVIKKSSSKKDPHPAKDLSETTTPKDSASSVTESKDLGTVPAPEATGSQPKKVSKKKSKTLPKASPEDAETLAMVVESPKKSKKRKHRTEGHDSRKDDGTISKNDVEEPPKKRHKNRTEFADPRADSTLNAQSRKALEYAFLQMNRPSKWKFNKARQNWLIRNIWNPDAISNIHFPFVLKYLTNVQGGSREKLKESCQTYLKLPEVTDTVQADEATSLTPKSILKAPSSTAKPTPGPLIDPSPTTGVSIASDSVLPPTATTGLSAESLAAIRRKRAHTLYDALCSDASASVET